MQFESRLSEESTSKRIGTGSAARQRPYLFHALRLFLGVVFLYASHDKILQPQAFALTVHNYQLLPDSLINLTALVLPWLELVLGLCLISGLWLPGTTVISTGLLAAFMSALIFNLWRGLDIHCGCFSTQADDGPAGLLTVVRDLSFLAASVYLTAYIYRPNRPTRPVYRTRRPSVLRNNLLVLIVACILLAPVFLVADVSAAASEDAASTEVIIFTDYFCPPCQSIEPYLEQALAELHQLGVKVTLVDKPISGLTPLYSKYYLYAAKATPGFKETLHIRRVLFDIAHTRSVETERDLINRLKQANIKLSITDVNPVFEEWTELIQRFAVRSTPTCIVMQPGQPVRTHIGRGNISKAIDLLLKELYRKP